VTGAERSAAISRAGAFPAIAAAGDLGDVLSAKIAKADPACAPPLALTIGAGGD